MRSESAVPWSAGDEPPDSQLYGEPPAGSLPDDAGPLYRQYAVTSGRVEPATGHFDLLTYIVTSPTSRRLVMVMQPEHRAILSMASTPISVAEVAAELNLAIGIVRVLLGDLLENELISVHQPPVPTAPATEHVLRKVLDGLRNL